MLLTIIKWMILKIKVNHNLIITLCNSIQNKVIFFVYLSLIIYFFFVRLNASLSKLVK